MSPLEDQQLGLENVQHIRKYVVGQTVDPQTGDPSLAVQFGTGWSASPAGVLNGDSSGVNPAGGWRPPQFYRDSDGIVHLEGHARYAGGSAQTVIFTLPADYAPAEAVVLGPGGAVVTPDGAVHAPFAAKAGVDDVKLAGKFHVPAIAQPVNDPL